MGDVNNIITGDIHDVLRTIMTYSRATLNCEITCDVNDQLAGDVNDVIMGDDNDVSETLMTYSERQQ